MGEQGVGLPCTVALLQGGTLSLGGAASIWGMGAGHVGMLPCPLADGEGHMGGPAHPLLG